MNQKPKALVSEANILSQWRGLDCTKVVEYSTHHWDSRRILRMKISSVSLLMRCFGSQDVCDIQLAINETLNAVTAENREQMRENVC